MEALNLLKAVQDKMKDADVLAKTAEKHKREANQVKTNLAVKRQKESVQKVAKGNSSVIVDAAAQCSHCIIF